MNSAAAGICMIGFGEAGQAFVEGWGVRRPGRITAFDINPSKTAANDQTIVDMQETASAALSDVGAVFCLVTAGSALDAARDAAQSGALRPGALWFDGNSCAPGTKRAAADLIEAAGARYVDLAIMAPVRPGLHKVPLLVSGPHADIATDLLVELGMNPTIAGPEVGQGSTIKMLRSVMVKGIEALTAECFLAARQAGVDADVLASLAKSDPGMAWAQRATYNLERMTSHGKRRSEEMAEVAITVAELNLPADMSLATTKWQGRIGALGLDQGPDDIGARLDQILSNLR